MAAKTEPDPVSRELVRDIGGSQQSERIKTTLLKKLFRPDDTGRYFLPDILFSDDQGLDLWQDINRGQGYYQTDDEVDLLETNAEKIAHLIPDGANLIDLGCGDVRKVLPLLDALDKRGRDVRYYGLDLSRSSVQRGIGQLRSRYPRLISEGLWGTFEDGLQWSEKLDGRRVFLSLGSIFGNDRFERAVKYLTFWTNHLRSDDLMLIGVDGCSDIETVWRSYHDPAGNFETFIRNAFHASNKILESAWYRDEDWSVAGSLQEDPVAHKFVLTANKDICDPRIALTFSNGAQIECYEGFKHGPTTMRLQFQQAGLTELGSWSSSSGRIHEYMVAPLRGATTNHSASVSRS